MDKRKTGKEPRLRIAVIHGVKAQTHLDFEIGMNETIGGLQGLCCFKVLRSPFIE